MVDLGKRTWDVGSGTGEMKKSESVAIHSDVVLTLKLTHLKALCE